MKLLAMSWFTCTPTQEAGVTPETRIWLFVLLDSRIDAVWYQPGSPVAENTTAESRNHIFFHKKHSCLQKSVESGSPTVPMMCACVLTHTHTCVITGATLWMIMNVHFCLVGELIRTHTWHRCNKNMQTDPPTSMPSVNLCELSVSSLFSLTRHGNKPSLFLVIYPCHVLERPSGILPQRFAPFEGLAGWERQARFGRGEGIGQGGMTGRGWTRWAQRGSSALPINTND